MKSNVKTMSTIFMFGIMYLMFSGVNGCTLVGDLVRGGLLYDKWWEVAGVLDSTEPTVDHLLWITRADSESNPRTGADTWRCKECHGWDYMGVDGAYGSGSHRTGFDGIYDTSKEKDASDLTEGLSAGGIMDFSDYLSEQDIADLVAFMKDGLINMNTYIDLATKEVDGDAMNGETLYLGIGDCITCHGVDGKAIDFGDGEGVGDVAGGNPWETLHKIRFGNPGSDPEMPSAITNGLSIQEQVDILAYSQTLAE